MHTSDKSPQWTPQGPPLLPTHREWASSPMSTKVGRSKLTTFILSSLISLCSCGASCMPHAREVSHLVRLQVQAWMLRMERVNCGVHCTVL
jgi:hypothetical protein